MPLNVCRAMSSFCQSDALCCTKVYKQVGAAAQCDATRRDMLYRAVRLKREVHSRYVCRVCRMETANFDFVQRTCPFNHLIVLTLDFYYTRTSTVHRGNVSFVVFLQLRHHKSVLFGWISSSFFFFFHSKEKKKKDKLMQ